MATEQRERAEVFAAGAKLPGYGLVHLGVRLCRPALDGLAQLRHLCGEAQAVGDVAGEVGMHLRDLRQ